MIIHLSPFLLLLAFSVHAQDRSIESVDCLLPAEKQRLRGAEKLDDRIKIYQAALGRCRSSVQGAIAKQDSTALSDTLSDWMILLEHSLQDVEATADRKKKSKALIRYEIQLRKALDDLDESKLKVNYEQMEELGTWLGRAERIRKRFVDILFQR
jgi:hypothetical protein